MMPRTTIEGSARVAIGYCGITGSDNVPEDEEAFDLRRALPSRSPIEHLGDPSCSIGSDGIMFEHGDFPPLQRP